MEIDLNEVLSRLGKQVGDLSVRLALAEAQVEALQKAEVERFAQQEASDDGG